MSVPCCIVEQEPSECQIDRVGPMHPLPENVQKRQVISLVNTSASLLFFIDGIAAWNIVRRIGCGA